MTIRFFKTSILYLLLFFLCLGNFQVAQAQDYYKLKNADVVVGMTYADVLKIWGAPENKITQEAKRIDIWRYDQQLVYFKEGKVFKNEEVVDGSLLATSVPEQPKEAKPQERQPDSAQMEQILSEIIGSTNR